MTVSTPIDRRGFLLIIGGFVKKSCSVLVSGAKENMTKMPADYQDEDEVEDFKPLTAQEASAWRARFPQVSVWRMVAVQAVVGVIVALLAWLVTGRAAAGWSAGYGALSVVLPAALFARGVVRQRPGGAGAAMAGIFGWELVKLVLCIAMLAAAPKLVPNLSWLALLVGLIVVMKTYWIALLVRSGVQKTD
jgi:ATP synthase protein I